jgi:hypothetical protein
LALDDGASRFIFVSDTDSTRGPAAESNPPKRVSFVRILVRGCAGSAILLILIFVFSQGGLGGIKQARHSSWMQATRQIGMMMFQYAMDNDGKYPDGNSSTEVFQKLIDKNYCTDPTIFFTYLFPVKSNLSPDRN